LIVNFIIPRWQPWKLVMYILYKIELYSKYTTEVLQHKNNTSIKIQQLQHNYYIGTTLVLKHSNYNPTTTT